MLIAWTTVATEDEAERMASNVIALELAACVQISRITSHYRWKGRAEKSPEFSLAFKCLPSQVAPLEAHVLGHHPYETPEWIVVRAERVSEKYLSWADPAPK